MHDNIITNYLYKYLYIKYIFNPNDEKKVLICNILINYF